MKLQQMVQLFRRRTARRCQSISRRTKNQCGNAAERGKIRCRFHGARAGAPKGNQNSLKHGQYTAAAIDARRELSDLVRMVRRTCSEIV